MTLLRCMPERLDVRACVALESTILCNCAFQCNQTQIFGQSSGVCNKREPISISFSLLFRVCNISRLATLPPADNRNTSTPPKHNFPSQSKMCVYLTHRHACGHCTTPALCEMCPSFYEAVQAWEQAGDTNVPRPPLCPINPVHNGNLITRRIEGICFACHERRHAEESARFGARRPPFDARPDGAERRSRKR